MSFFGGEVPKKNTSKNRTHFGMDSTKAPEGSSYGILTSESKGITVTPLPRGAHNSAQVRCTKVRSAVLIECWNWFEGICFVSILQFYSITLLIDFPICLYAPTLWTYLMAFSFRLTAASFPLSHFPISFRESIQSYLDRMGCADGCVACSMCGM